MKPSSIFSILFMLVVAVSCDDEDDGNGGSNRYVLNVISEGYNSPLQLAEPPDNSGRLFVLDQSGQIYIVKDGSRLDQPFLNIQSKILLGPPPDERGLLGLAFHPQYATNGKFYVYYAGPLRSGGPIGWDHTNFVAEYKVSGNADLADAATERIVLAVDHPQANHNGGTIAFGPDGYLYISIGDGGSGNDTAEGHVDDWYTANTGGNGQDITQNLLGNVLRIDVNMESGYGIPADNPFVATEGLDEIYAYGLRNPYRFSFAPDNTLILADAGQELYEEINVIEKGGNYGWNVKEGNHCFSTSTPSSPPASCPAEDNLGNALVDPVIEFGNTSSLSDGLGNVSIGGYVYHGEDVPSLSGEYIFGVLTQDPEGMNGAVFAANRAGGTWDYDKLGFNNLDGGELSEFVLGFGQDNAGEVYVLTSGGAAGSGKVYRIAKD
jgi:glucose/arabinose dehydrogenase